ncbi:MAG: universal stress protein [Cyclobacteriaceae bacterium]
MNKILVPYDFSEQADYAYNFAIELANASSATKVLLFHVIEHPSESRLKYMGATDMDPMENVFMNKLINLTEDKLEAKVSEAGKVEVEYKVRMGNTYQTLSDEVGDEEVDLVVMGTTGSEGLDAMFIGSNAEKIVRSARCPVITLQAPAEVSAINDLVFASNFHELQDDFVKRMLDLQQFLGAELRLVKINTPANFTSTRHDLKKMNDFVDKYAIKNYTIDIYNYMNEEDGIVNYVEDINADMVALGTHQRKGIIHFLNGSIAEDVVNQAKRPVWTYQLD